MQCHHHLRQCSIYLISGVISYFVGGVGRGCAQSVAHPSCKVSRGVGAGRDEFMLHRGDNKMFLILIGRCPHLHHPEMTSQSMISISAHMQIERANQVPCFASLQSGERRIFRKFRESQEKNFQEFAGVISNMDTDSKG